MWAQSLNGDGSSYRFQQCVFTRNDAVSDGGAVRIIGAPAHFNDTIFDTNQAAFGGALYLSDSTTDIMRCTFQNNTASYAAWAGRNIRLIATTSARRTEARITASNLLADGKEDFGVTAGRLPTYATFPLPVVTYSSRRRLQIMVFEKNNKSPSSFTTTTTTTTIITTYSSNNTTNIKTWYGPDGKVAGCCTICSVLTTSTRSSTATISSTTPSSRLLENSAQQTCLHAKRCHGNNRIERSICISRLGTSP